MKIDRQRMTGLKAVLMVCLAVGLMVGFGSVVHAETVGAGIGILDLANPNIQVDTPSDGNTDQSRQNVDQSFPATLPAGIYNGTSWSFRAGQTGSVIPYLAFATGPDSYEILSVGARVDVDVNGLDVDITVPFDGNDFVLANTTEIFGGIVNPTEAGSQNPVYTNLNSGWTVDHDNNADGNLSPAVVGGAVVGLGHVNLGRSYAFSIDVERVPEPSSFMLCLLGIWSVIAFRGYRRKTC